MPADFRALSTARHLAKVTYASEVAVDDFLANPDAHVERVVIPRHGSSAAPREAWKITTPAVRACFGMLRIQFEAFLRQWFADLYPLPCLHGYVAKHSALTNARLHAGHSRFLHVDVRSFFPSIRADVLQAAFLRLGLTRAGAELLARIGSRDGSLPLGYPTSPLFSNLVLADVDRQLLDLATPHGATYTRYADDLTFSGNAELPTRAEVGDLLGTLGLTVHPTKSRERKRGQALYVTGYSVSEASPRAPRALKKRLRQALYYTRKHGLANHVAHLGRASVTAEHDRIVGQLQHVRHVEREIGDLLLAQWDARPKERDGNLARPLPGVGTPVLLLFDDSGFKFFGSDYRALGVVILRDPEAVRAQLKDLTAEFLLSDTMPEPARDLVRAEGLHFNTLPLDFRRDAISAVARMPIRAHVVFDQATGAKKAQMTAFLRRALKWRLGDCAGKLVTVVFEEGEYINQREAEPLVTEVYNSLPRERRPLRIDGVRVAGKLAEPCLALADIYLGAWQQFACDREPKRLANRARDELLFRTLQPRIGTIFNPSTGIRFTSRAPFDGLEAPAAEGNPE